MDDFDLHVHTRIVERVIDDLWDAVLGNDVWPRKHVHEICPTLQPGNEYLLASPEHLKIVTLLDDDS